MTVASLNIPLQAPGTENADRVNQLDLSRAKWFQLGKTRRIIRLATQLRWVSST